MYETRWDEHTELVGAYKRPTKDDAYSLNNHYVKIVC